MLAAVVILFCLLSLVEPRMVGDDPPGILEEIVYETNVYLVQQKLDVVDVPPIKRSGWFYNFEVIGGKVGNFSTSVIVGDPNLNETTLPNNVDGYFFNMGISLTDFKIQVDYKAKLFGIISYSGTLNIASKGNAVQTLGVVKSYSDKCEVDVNDLKLKKIGKLSLSIQPSRISHWFLEKIAAGIVHMVAPFSYGMVTSIIKEVAATDKVKNIINEIMCRYF